MKRFSGFLLVLSLAMGTPLSAFAVPAYLSHQGKILDSSQEPISVVTEMTFSLYTQASGGSAVWSETMDLSLDGGLYSVILGTTTTLEDSLFEGGNLYLGVQVEDNNEFDPRTQVVSVPFAFRAAISDELDADTLDGYLADYVTSTDFTFENLQNVPDDLSDGDNDTLADLECDTDQMAQWSGSEWVCADAQGLWTPAEGSISYSDGNVGIGVTDPVVALEVNGGIKLGAVSECNSELVGTLRYNANLETLELCNGTNWSMVSSSPSVGLDQSQPGSSCSAILATNSAMEDGVYWVDPNGESIDDAFQVFCDMTTDGGGWTLVMMVKSDDFETFKYNSAHWSSEESLNPEIVDPGHDDNMKNPAYWLMPFEEIRLDMTTLGNSHQITTQNSSALAIFTGSLVNSPYDRAGFLNWIPQAANSWDNQSCCNQRGFQSAYSAANCRYGIIMNNECNECGSADSAVGFGCHSNNYSADRWSACGGHRWNPSERYNHKGWVFVR